MVLCCGGIAMWTESLAPVYRTGTAHPVDQRLLELFVVSLRAAMEDIATLRFQHLLQVTWFSFHHQSSKESSGNSDVDI